MKGKLGYIFATVALFTAAAMFASGAAKPAVAQQAEQQRIISLQGTGEVSVSPDVAAISVGVETQAEEAGEALSENSESMQAVIDALLVADIAEEDIRTHVVRLQPQYEQQPPQPRREGPTPIVGFVATNMVDVRLRDIEALGEVLDAAVAAGANLVQDIRFEISQPEEAQAQARELAWDSAEARATQLAELAGVELAEVLTINESSQGPIPVARAAIGLEAAAVPIQPGTQTVSVNLQVTWRIVE